jgi:hypothetical protein
MYGRGVCTFSLRLPSSTQIVADLGTLRCAQSK